MHDRQPTKPGRVLITPEDGSAPFYAVLARADEPTDPGTPYNKATQLTDETSALLGGAETVNEAFRRIADITLPTVTFVTDAGVSITIEKIETKITGIADSTGIFEVRLTSLGLWRITAVLGHKHEVRELNVDSLGAHYTVYIPLIRIYGASWDGTAATTLSRTDSATLFPNPVPYVKGARTYGSPFDNLAPWKYMERSYDGEAGETVKVPKFWYKLTQVGTKGGKIQIADEQVDGYSVCPACMDRNDGKGERDYVLVGRYHCAENNFRSTTGVKPRVSVAQATFRQNIHNLGSTIYMMDFATWFTIWLLYIVEFADWNSQKTIGKGCGNNSAIQEMGYTDDMPYHTGTMQTSRDTYGVGTQYRYIEGLWENCYDRLTGCYNSSNGLMVEVHPANFAESSGGKSVGTPVSGWIMGLKVTESGPFPCFINSDPSWGGEAAGVCDYWSFKADNPVVYVGSSYGQNNSRGMFCVDCTTLANASTGLGSRILKLP